MGCGVCGQGVPEYLEEELHIQVGDGVRVADGDNGCRMAVGGGLMEVLGRGGRRVELVLSGK
jgi:hypothetical protein